LLEVEELTKLPHQQCQHQCDTGCAIHESRPKECRVYQCQWKADENIPEEFRPDKLDCIIDIHDTVLGPAVICHQSYPQQWLKEPIIGIIQQLANHHQCWIYAIHGNDRQAAFPKWASEQQSKFDKMAESGSVPELRGKIIYPAE
jgi:hypothetical protein